jgi:branched-chain amino acid aminotransferase
MSAAKITGEKIWLDGQLVDWDDAQIHVLSHTLHYGLGVFEGIFSYKTHDDRSAIFRLREHVRRLFDSAHINLLEIPYTSEQLEAASLATLNANGLTEGYIRPLVFLGEGAMGINPANNAVRVAIIAWPWGAYLGEDGMMNGVRAKVSTFSRHHINSKMTNGKTCGDYVNSILAKREALLDGFDEAIMLDTQGLISEATGANIFVVRDGAIRTPQAHTILAGITRDTVMQIAAEQGLSLVETTLTRDDLYIADEVFLCGTAAEVTPVRELDHRKIGSGGRGPVTEQIQAGYFDIVQGKNEKFISYLTYL